MEQIEAIQEGSKGVCRLPGPRVPLSGLLWPPPLGSLAGRGRRPGPRGCRWPTGVRPCFGLITSPQSKSTSDLKAAIRQGRLFRKTAHQKPSVATQGPSTRVRAEGGHVPAAPHRRPTPSAGHGARVPRVRVGAPQPPAHAQTRRLASSRCCARRPRGGLSASRPAPPSFATPRRCGRTLSHAPPAGSPCRYTHPGVALCTLTPGAAVEGSWEWDTASQSPTPAWAKGQGSCHTLRGLREAKARPTPGQAGQARAGPATSVRRQGCPPPRPCRGPGPSPHTTVLSPRSPGATETRAPLAAQRWEPSQLQRGSPCPCYRQETRAQTDSSRVLDPGLLTSDALGRPAAPPPTHRGGHGVGSWAPGSPPWSSRARRSR